MPIRPAEADDLAAMVAIYNAAIPGRLATADTEPVTVESRRAWFDPCDTVTRPVWVAEDGEGGVAGWLSLHPFYGRPAYRATVEISVYCAPGQQRRGVGRSLVAHALACAPALGVRTVLAFVFSHNLPSVRLFAGAGFESWGALPGVAELDGVERDLTILGRRLDE